jgi:hypothetical protein
MTTAALGRTRVSLARLSDEALAGLVGGYQKIAAWAGGMLLEGIAEHAGRRPDDRTPRRIPGGRRPAQQCDDDHTTARDSEGQSCECNIAPQCKR